MGNQTSNSNNSTNTLKPKPISQIMDYVATHYILTMNFQSLKKLYEQEYCDKLVVITSDIVQRYFTDLEITYLSQRIKNGIEVNEQSKDNVMFFDRDSLYDLDVQNSFKKKRICQSIAKFYIKIAHIFSAVVTTINPIFVYKDVDGNTIKASLFEKDKIPVNVPRDIFKMNICSERVSSLAGKNPGKKVDISDIMDEDHIYVGPTMCDVNMDINTGDTKNLHSEPGIPELETLYYDDGYDYKTGQFMSMSEETQKIYNSDLKIFYNVFTGEQTMPDTIKKFSDVKLRDYHKISKCQGNRAPFRETYIGDRSNQLFKDYAENLKNMIRRADTNQEALLEIINKLFVYTIDPQTNQKHIRISPTLTEQQLQTIVVDARALIIKLYLTCEMDYVNGLKIYEAIVESKIFETSQKQINNLEKLTETLLSDGATIESESESVIGAN